MENYEPPFTITNEMLSEYVRKLLGVMEYNVPYTGKTLIDRLGLKSRETFRRNYLHPAIEQGLVRMSISDKPQSRNQRYVKTERFRIVLKNYIKI